MTDVTPPEGHYFTTHNHRHTSTHHTHEVTLWRRRYNLGGPLAPERVGYAYVAVPPGPYSWQQTCDALKAEILDDYDPSRKAKADALEKLRKEYNTAVANGLPDKAHHLDRRMKSLGWGND